ncbi:MAG: hypothetical protein K8R85_07680, partial [Bacteroidetes bacterium]|nr:hypothetical protein [Bacteroidota bacterium]
KKMSNKKLFAIILSAVLLTSVVTVAAYKIFTKNTDVPTLTTNPNFESIVDSIDYSENLLDSNEVYKQNFDEDLTSQGKWIPIKSRDLIQDLTSPSQTETPLQNVSNVSNDNSLPENTSVARNIAPADNETFVEEVSTTNLTSPNENANVKVVTETKTIEKIIYVWQPNECNESSWNPYSNGRWEFTCAGWVWASDYRWGRHCYNYGRWVWTSFAGWVWMPGGRWAPNWVTWRYCGNYNGNSYIGWYPTCPVLYWTNYQSHLVVCNSHFSSNPIHWTVVNQKDLTGKINLTTKVHPEKNSVILNNSGKVRVNTLAIDDQKVKYNGPNVNVISQVTKSTITPKYIEIPVDPKNEKNSAGTKQTVVSDPVSKVRTTKNTSINGNELIDKIRRTNVSNPNVTTDPNITTNPVNPKTSTTKTLPVKTADPSVNPVKTTDKTKTDPPAKTVTPPKSTTTPKNETPANGSLFIYL